MLCISNTALSMPLHTLFAPNVMTSYGVVCFTGAWFLEDIKGSPYLSHELQHLSGRVPNHSHLPTPMHSLSDQVSEFCTVTKSRYKFGFLQIFNILDTESRIGGQWQYVPSYMMTDIIELLKHNKIPITGTTNKYINYLFKTL